MATSVLGDLKSVYHRTWWALMLRGVLGLVVGIYILARPLDSVAAFALVIAFWALFAGSVEIVQAFELKAIMKHWWVLLLAGLVGVAFGISAAVMQKSLGMPWGWTVAFGALSVVAGLFALLAPPVTLAAITGLIAGFAIVSGVAFVVGAFKLRSVIHL
ncbi:MAG TPA: DUF308 domain-containing protein [Gemmatimonadales bacterium]|nr:DUF308 domain-containing protein [Gemmatimonadales bacterium]